MNKKQIKKLLSERLQSRIDEELLKKKGSFRKVSGKRQKLNVKSSKDYAKKLAPMLVDELSRSIHDKIISNFSLDDSNKKEVIRTLESQLSNRGVGFEGNAINSVELEDVNFSEATISWTSNKVAIEGQLQFPVNGTAFVTNTDFGDVDERDSRYVHTLIFKYSLARRTLSILGLDIVTKV